MQLSSEQMPTCNILLFFCLQAQQALLSVQWPEGLGMDEPALSSADSISARRPSRECAAGIRECAAVPEKP
jgi:hypothetical protein